MNPTPEDLESKLELHREWVTSLGQRGVKFDIEGADLPNLNLSLRNLAEIILFRSRFNGTIFHNCDLYASMLSRSLFLHVVMTEVILTKADVSDAVFISSNLEGANAFRAVFYGATFENVNLSKTDLRLANLMHTIFRNVSFRSAQLERATFHGAVLELVDFENAQGIDTVRGDNVTIVESNGRFTLGDTDAFRKWLKEISAKGKQGSQS